MQHVLTRVAGDAHAWLGELPDWAAVDGVGVVDSYWRWQDSAPPIAVQRYAAWGYRVGFGGHGEYGLLGASYEPHEYPVLRVALTRRKEPAAERTGLSTLHAWACLTSTSVA